MFLPEKIAKDKKNFKDICQKYKVKFLYGFGSSVTDNFDQNKSDDNLI